MAGTHSSVQAHVLAESLESALIRVFVLQNLNSFKMNTYEKHGAGVSRSRFPGIRFGAKAKTIPKERRCVLTL